MRIRVEFDYYPKIESLAVIKGWIISTLQILRLENVTWEELK